MDPGWVIAAISIATVLAGLLTWGFRWLWRIGRRTWMFMDDWNGEEATPGHPGHPGVMERLVNVELTTQKILHEVTLNSGMSVKDVVNSTEAAVTVLQGRVESVARQVENLPGGNS